MATKLEAFDARGASDYLLSHDLEDVLSVVDGRPELGKEVAEADARVRRFLSGRIRELLDTQAFLEAVPGHLRGDAASQARLATVMAPLETIAGAA